MSNKRKNKSKTKSKNNGAFGNKKNIGADVLAAGHTEMPVDAIARLQSCKDQGMEVDFIIADTEMVKQAALKLYPNATIVMA